MTLFCVLENRSACVHERAGKLDTQGQLGQCLSLFLYTT